MLYHTQRGGYSNLKFGFVFCRVCIFSEFAQILFALKAVLSGLVRQETEDKRLETRD